MTRVLRCHAVPRGYWNRPSSWCLLLAGLSLLLASCGSGSADTRANVETDRWNVGAAQVSSDLRPRVSAELRA